MIVLYAGHTILGLLALVLFFDVALLLTPDLLGGNIPSRGVIWIAALTPALMLMLIFLTALPAAMRTAFGRTSGEFTAAGREIASSYTGCIMLVVGLSLIALVASIPILVLRLLFRLLS